MLRVSYEFHGLQTIVSFSSGDEVSSCLYFVQLLSSFFPYCGLSYADLVTGQGVDPLTNLICGGELPMFIVPLPCRIFMYLGICKGDSFLSLCAFQTKQTNIWIVFAMSNMEQCFQVSI